MVHYIRHGFNLSWRHPLHSRAKPGESREIKQALPTVRDIN
jgi:hypothetical protein